MLRRLTARQEQLKAAEQNHNMVTFAPFVRTANSLVSSQILRQSSADELLTNIDGEAAVGGDAGAAGVIVVHHFVNL